MEIASASELARQLVKVNLLWHMEKPGSTLKLHLCSTGPKANKGTHTTTTQAWTQGQSQNLEVFLCVAAPDNPTPCRLVYPACAAGYSFFIRHIDSVFRSNQSQTLAQHGSEPVLCG